MKTEAISVEYIDHMGSDLSVVNAARASFDKTSTWDEGMPTSTSTRPPAIVVRKLREADRNLIRFLARGYRTEEWDKLADTFLAAESRPQVAAMLTTFKRHAQHWAPFAHPHLSLRVTAPMFIARQMVKHQVGAVWSEVSRRYVSDEPTFWLPEKWHTRPGDIKQGAGGEVEHQDSARFVAWNVTEEALGAYKRLLRLGVAPEEARIVLPLNTMTTWVWTGSLLFWSRVANQRLDGHAQLAAQETARGIADIVSAHFPESWAALVE